MTLYSFRLCALLLAVLLGTSGVWARSAEKKPKRSRVSQAERKALHTADEAKDTIRSIELRLALLPKLSAQDAEDAVLEAYRLVIGLPRDSVGLVQVGRVKERLISEGRHAEVRELMDLRRREAVDSIIAIGKVEDARFARAFAAVDSVRALQFQQAEQSVSAMERMRAAEEDARRWQWAMVAVVVVSVLWGFWSTYSARSQVRRLRRQTVHLRAEIDRIHERKAVGIQEPTVLSRGPGADRASAQEAVQSNTALDPVLISLLRKQGPQRLEALGHARSIGDKATVVRLVHTMKPLLVSLRPSYFGSLCAMLTAPGAHEEGQLWEDRLDELELAVRSLMEGR